MRLTVVLLFSVIYLHSAAQQCEGSLGENIFERGTFGAGSVNIPPEDPEIAPGYQYVRNGPPSDGFYTLTNNTDAWENLYETWLRIEDNSANPDGYMMVVNADFSPGIFYSEVVQDLCENTLYEFSADVINMIRQTVPDHIFPSVDFLLDGEVQFSTGDIPQNERWNRYGFTFRTPPGVSEMTLTLRNNAPGGIGNDLALDNISFRACGPNAFVEFDSDQTIFLCEDENNDVLFTADLGNSGYEIQWQLSQDRGLNWVNLQGSQNAGIIHNDFRPGTYRYRYLAAPNLSDLENFKCRTISDELEIEVLPIRHTVIDTICAGLPYPLGDQQIFAAGEHMASLTSSKGCDSIVSLTLSHVQDPDIQIDYDVVHPICAGDSTGMISVGAASGSAGPYKYTLEGVGTDANSMLLRPAGQYWLAAQDRFSCRDSVAIDLVDPVAFVISAGPDTMLQFGDQIERSVEANYPILETRWQPPSYLDCADCSTAQIIGIENIRYQLEATSELGCSAQTTLNIAVDRSVKTYIPTAFSPNGDGHNDYFNLYAPGFAIQEIEELLIFNRWGSLVFEATGVSINADASGWDGTIGGEPAGQDTYLYSARLRLLDDSIEVKTGTVVLVR